MVFWEKKVSIFPQAYPMNDIFPRLNATIRSCALTTAATSKQATPPLGDIDG